MVNQQAKLSGSEAVLFACRDVRSLERKALMGSWLPGPGPDGRRWSCQAQAGLPTELQPTVTVATPPAANCNASGPKH